MTLLSGDAAFWANVVVVAGALGVGLRTVLRLRDDDREQTRKIAELEKRLDKSESYGRDNSGRLAKIEFTIENHEGTLAETRLWKKQVEETLQSIDQNLTVLTTKLDIKE